MATEDISLRVRLDQVEAALRSIPGMTEASMKQVASAAAKNWKEVEKQAKEAAKAAQKASEKAAAEAQKASEQQLNAMKQLGNAVTGGLVGDLADMAEALGPVGLAAATATGAFVGLAAATTALVGGILAVQEAAKTTVEELDKLGKSELITPEQRASIEAADVALQSIKLSVGLVAVALADNFAPEIEQAALAVVSLSFSLGDLIDKLRNTSILENFAISALTVAESLIDLQTSTAIVAAALGNLQSAITGQPSELAKWGDAIILAKKDALSAATGIDRRRDAVEQGSEADRRARDFIDGLRTALQKAREEAAKSTQQHKTLADTVDEQGKAQQALARILREATSDQETAEMKLLRTHVERSEAAKKAITDETALAKALAVINARLYRDWDKLEAEKQTKLDENRRKQLEAARKEAEAYTAFLQTQAVKQQEIQLEALNARLAASQAIQDAIEAEDAAEQAAFDRLTDRISGVADAAMMLATTLSELSRQRIGQIDDEQQALRKQLEAATGYERLRIEQRLKSLADEEAAYKRAALTAFRIRQGAAIAETIVNGVVAASRALAELGPVAGGIAAGVIAAATTANVALIAAEQPRFHAGLDPSETPAILTRGEGVANARAMSQPGFADELRAANAGLPSPVSAPVVIALNDRVLAQLDARTRRIRGRDFGSRTMVRLGSANHYMGG